MGRYLIPFKNRKKDITEVQLVIGYKGMIDLMRRSGEVVAIHSDVAFKGDEFDFEYGTEAHFRHKPTGKSDEPEYAYCHVKLKDDGEAFIVWPYSKILERRNSSQGYKTAVQYGNKTSPWIAHEYAMARKTMVRAIFNYMPISIEKVADALQFEDEKPDYAAFALDPDAGVMIEGALTDDVVDDQDGAPEEPPRTTNSQKVDTPPKTEAKPAPKAKVDTTSTPKADTAPEPKPEPEADPEQSQMLYEMVVAELDACNGDFGSVSEVWGPQIDQMKSDAPDLYASLEGQFPAYFDA